MFQKILVPLDGSPLAEGILPHVKVLAKGLGSQVILLHAVEAFPLDYVDGELEPYAARAAEFIHPLAEGYLERITRKLVSAGLEAEMKLVQGRAADEILAYAEGEGVGLIAMSTRGRSGPPRSILGSTADRVLRCGEQPVLLVRPPNGGVGRPAAARLSRMVVPLDGSPIAETVLPLLDGLGGALELEIVLIQVVGVETTVEFGGTNYDTRLVPNDVLQRLVGQASEYLADVARELEGKGLRARWEVLGGSPANRVIDFARETPDCVVAMTTHGRSGFRRWIMGSVADRVVRQTSEPVLVVCDHSAS